MAVAANKIFWGFLFYVKHNPHKTVEAMTWPDLHAMATAFAKDNATSGTLTAATALTHANEGFGVVDFSTDVTFPVYAAATRESVDAGGTAATTTLAGNKLICERSMYPEKHIT